MSALFLKTADNEKEHAKMWFKELAGIGDTKENLAAAEGEIRHMPSYSQRISRELSSPKICTSAPSGKR